MKILDANIFIYAPEPAFAHLRPLLVDSDCVTSDVTRVEVLGFHRLDHRSKTYYEAVFGRMTCLPITKDVLDQAISLRQIKKMSLGDSIVAATALQNNLELNTRNISDFAHIKGLLLVNPV
jgi:toxin FitB